MTKTAALDAIVEEITIQAGAAKIFDALTSPAEILKWWSAEGMFRTTCFENDLRVGGKWMTRVAGPGGDGPETVVKGEYRAIERPWLLSYTWQRFGEGEDERETLVTWELDEKDGITTVRVSHTGLITGELRSRNNGWPLILKLLRTHMRRFA